MRELIVESSLYSQLAGTAGIYIVFDTVEGDRIILKQF